MKNLKFLRNTLILAVGLFAYQSCDENDNLYPQLTVEPLSITEIIEEDSSLSTLSASLSQVGLDSMFALTTTYTFFAPNDDAFGNVTLEATTDEEVENILLNHALSTVTADFISKFETGYYHTLGTGPLGLNLSLYINNANSAIFNGKAELVAGAYDKGATNGVMHTVNAVLLPPTLTDHVFANPDYTSLYEALVLTELDKVLAVIAMVQSLSEVMFCSTTSQVAMKSLIRSVASMAQEEVALIWKMHLFQFQKCQILNLIRSQNK